MFGMFSEVEMRFFFPPQSANYDEEEFWGTQAGMQNVIVACTMTTARTTFKKLKFLRQDSRVHTRNYDFDTEQKVLHDINHKEASVRDRPMLLWKAQNALWPAIFHHKRETV